MQKTHACCHVSALWSDKSQKKKQNDVDKEYKEKQSQAINFVIVYTLASCLKGATWEPAQLVSLTKSAKKAFPSSAFLFLGVLNISAYSQLIIAIEVAFFV